MFFDDNSVLGDFFDFTIISKFADKIDSLSTVNFENIKVFMNSYDDKYVIEGIFPGINKKDIIIDYKDDYINIKVSGENYRTSYNMFRKIFYVPRVDVSNMNISYENEVLHFELPKLFLKKEKLEIIDVNYYENK